MFTDDEWLPINSTDVYEAVIFNNNELSNLKAFPVLRITKLDLAYNKIDKLEDNLIKNLENLEILDLSYNRLTSTALTPKVFEGNYDADTYEPMKKLTVLRLSGNSLHTLDIDLFEHFPNLEELYLDLNPFRVIDQATEVAISGIPNLRVLDLAYMELKDLPEHIFHSPRGLKVLNITGNFFSLIPGALTYAINLERLTMDENPILYVGGNDSFPVLPKLTSLEMSYGRKLERIDKGGLSGLTALETLDISHNPLLSFIDPDMLSHPDPDSPERTIWPPIKYVSILMKLPSNTLSNSIHF